MSSERSAIVLRSRKTTRLRPRRPIVLSQSSSSQKSEKLSQGETWYSIKDIVAEKCKGGKLWYKIDWADDPVTGKEYHQSWIPAKDANKEAINNWKETKQRDRDIQRGIPSSSPPSQPVRRQNWRSKNRRRSGTLHQPLIHSTEQELDPEVIFDKSRDGISRGNLTVEIKQEPDFDRSKYKSITSSQLESTSPAIPPPQVLQHPFEPSQGPQGAIPQFDSQDTIPDSQELTPGPSRGTHSTQSQGRTRIVGPLQAKTQAISGDASSVKNSSSTGSPLVVERQAYQPESGGNQLPSAQINNLSLQPSTDELPSASNDLQFLTQAPFISESPGFHITSSPAKYSNPQLHQNSSIVPDSVPHRTTVRLSVSAGASTTASPSQAAQIVSPLESQRGGSVLESQILFDFGVNNDENLDLSTPDIIPETTRKNNTQCHQDDSQGSSSALSKVHNNVRRSFAIPPSRINRSTPRVAASSQGSQYLVPTIEEDRAEDVPSRDLRPPVFRRSRNRISPSSPSIRTQTSPILTIPVTPSHAIMDGTSSSTPMSAIEELRRIMPDYVPVVADSLEQAQPQEPTQAPVTEIEATLAAIAPNVEPAPAMGPLTAVDPLAVDPAIALTSDTANDAVSDAFQTAPDASSAPQLSAIDELRQSMALPSAEAPTTISPAALLNSMDIDSGPTTSMPMPDLATTESLVAEVLPTAESPSQEDAFQASLDDLITPVAHGPVQFVVTLPLAANVRPQYLDTIMKNRSSIDAFADCFTTGARRDPTPAVNADIDLMFRKLSDICDLPIYIESLPVMGETDMMKHATNSNSKFLFLHEFVESIRDLDKKVIVISQPGRVADFVEAVVFASGVRFRRLGEDNYARKSDSTDPLAVTICTTASDAPSLPADTDIVIAFDRDARSSRLLAGGQYFKEPVVLSLVATTTLEHIDLQISGENITPMERKNSLVFAVVHARQYLVHPDRKMREPHEAALHFGNHIRNPADEFIWEPQPIPDEVFQVFLSSSQVAQRGTDDPNDQSGEAGTTRKRQLDDSGVAEDSRKRARLSESTEAMSTNRGVNLSSRLRELLGGHVQTEGKTVQISVDQLESLAVKIDDLESRMKDQETIENTLKQEVRNLEASLKSHVKTIRKVQPKYMEAVSDRGKFEAERHKAVRTAESAAAKVTAHEVTISRLRSEKATLEEKLATATATLTTSSIPEIARLAEMEEKLAVAAKKAEAAEKRLATQNSDLEYSRTAYQNASNFAAEMSTENAELRAKVKNLERRANDNIVKVHAANKQNEVENAMRLYRGSQAKEHETELELERVKEELRARNNGRRETRGQSAGPRSPRLPGGVLSPAPPRRGAAAGGSASRGTSPAARGGETDGANMNLFNGQQGNGRWDHLRD